MNTKAVLLWGTVDQIGQACGVVVLIMVFIFGFAADEVGVSAADMGRGLGPNVPSGAAETALSRTESGREYACKTDYNKWS